MSSFEAEEVWKTKNDGVDEGICKSYINSLPVIKEPRKREKKVKCPGNLNPNHHKDLLKR